MFHWHINGLCRISLSKSFQPGSTKARVSATLKVLSIEIAFPYKVLKNTEAYIEIFLYLLTARPNITIVFFTNLMLKFFILIHLFYSSICFELYYAHLQENNCISTAPGIVTLFR